MNPAFELIGLPPPSRLHRSAMESLFPPTPPDRSPVGPGGQQRNTSSAATYRSGVGVGRNGGGRGGYNAAEDEVKREQGQVQMSAVEGWIS